MNKNEIGNLKVALVEDFSTTLGGTHRVLEAFHEIWTNAPIYTGVYFPERFDPPLEGRDFRESFVAKLPWGRKLQSQYLIFYQMAFERFDFSEYDLVISSTWAGYAKGVITPPDVKHFSYVHTPPRYLWGLPTSKHDSLPAIYRKIILPPLEHFWRIWDRQTAFRPDRLIANSKNIQKRIRKFYDRDSDVIYPPVESEDFSKAKTKSKDYFIYFGRLETYKRVDLAIKACAAAGEKLKIVGAGREKPVLEDLAQKLGAGDEIEFLGFQSDENLRKLVAEAKAFLFPCPTEDFGIVPVESMGAGTPVIAFNSGGVKETVIDGKTGVLVDEVSAESYTEAVKNFDPEKYLVKDCKERASEFSKERFKQNFLNYILKHFDEE